MSEINSNNQTWFPLILVALASFIITLDSTFMNVSITQLVIDLNTTVDIVQVIICFYTLITASLMLLAAKLQDIIGKRKVFLIGALIYGIGALIASISQNAGMLFFGWSLLEGMGGALMTPATVSIISGAYTGEKRTVALAISSAIIGIAAAIGPLFGGVVTTFLSWRYGFIFELLIIVFIFIFYKKIPSFKTTATRKDLDITGAILSILGLITFVYGILQLQDDFIKSIILMLIGIILIITYILYEKREKSKGNTPLFDVYLLKDKNLSTGTLIRLITMLAMAGSLFAMSIFLQSVLHLNAFITGISLLPLTLGMLIFSIIAPKLVQKSTHKKIMIIGFIISIIGCLILRYQFDLHTGFTDLMPGMFILGAGLGFIMALGLDISLANIPDESQNTASGFITTGQTLGSSMGTAIIGCILIIGAVGGMHDAINTYAPHHISDSEFKQNVNIYFEKLGTINTTELQHENTLKEKVVNTVIQDAMKLVMEVTALLLLIGMILTTLLKNMKTDRVK